MVRGLPEYLAPKIKVPKILQQLKSFQESKPISQAPVMFPKIIREIGNGRYELESEYEKIPDEECHEFDDILTKQRT